MLIQLHSALESGQNIKIQKLVDSTDQSAFGAFECGTQITLRATVPRVLGVSSVVLRIARDKGSDTDRRFLFVDSDGQLDTYELILDTEELCANSAHGLFYYEYLFVRGWDTLFSDSINNVDMGIATHTARRFRLLVFEKGFATPEWFHGGTMYHIFVDRFCKGDGKTALHGDAFLNPDWHHGIPQYARVAGEPLANNMFFGGNLWGIAEKLDYLHSLGVTVLYLSPIFDAYSNHRYDTGDYETVDSIAGGDEAFDYLVKEAKKYGMRIILDGVFNHTGDDSRYFNKRGTYSELGAYQSKKSPYASWFSFRKFPDDYECWWNIDIMPRLRQDLPECRAYFTGKDGICTRWIDRGAAGWRLDVADELSDAFLDEFRVSLKEATNGEGLLIGEVWENAADKIAYGSRRRYFSGRQLDSVMNYPFRNAVLAFLCQKDAAFFYNTLTELYGSYPRSVLHALMNLLGTHDTERILSLLGENEDKKEQLTNDQLAHLRLCPENLARAERRLLIASILQFTAYGVPSVYYGDEAGVEGYHDPFCRMPFPWGEENETLQAHYRALGALRARSMALKNGDFRFTSLKKDAFSYERTSDTETLLIIANMGADWKYPIKGTWKNALTGESITPVRGRINIPHESALILEKVDTDKDARHS